MTFKRTCDRCSRTITSGWSNSIFPRVMVLKIRPKTRIDLCNDCLNSLNEWLTTVKRLDNNLET
jgi:hypothetical protein